MARSPGQRVASRFGRSQEANSFSPTRGSGGRDIDFRNTNLINGEWASWESVSVSLTRIPRHINTFTLWKSFSKQGDIDYIEIFENARGRREGGGRIRFKPPPREAFWARREYLLSLENNESVSLDIRMDIRRPVLEIESPIQPGVKYPAIIELDALAVDFGSMVEKRSFLQLKSLISNRLGTIQVALNVAHRELCIYVHVQNLSARADNSRPNAKPFRFRIRFSQLTDILQTRSSQEVSLVIPLDLPAICHKKITALKEEHFPPNENIWNSQDTWFRQTDIVHYPEQIIRTPVNLRKQNSHINFGRWTTFRLSFHENTIRDSNKFQIFKNVLRDFNVKIQETDDFRVVKEAEPIPTVWKWIDAPSTHKSRPLSSLEDLEEDEYTPLPFTVRYQLEVCLSHQYLNEYTTNEAFVHRLAELGEKKAKELLEHVATNKTIYYNPVEIFNIPFPNGATNGKIPKHCCYIRSAEVTPSTIYYGIPSVDTSNRVFRYYQEYADRFLRVQFCDENHFGKIYPNPNGNNLSMREVYARVMRTLQEGITIGDRHYEFVAFGNSQFREHGACFFASLPHLTAANIRARMGDLNDIKVVAKYAARLGQCFSTTRAVTSCPVQITELEDIERNGYIFSDGVGRLSHFLTQMIQSELGIQTPSGKPPSVFQFRLGGCKGILAVSPGTHGREVHIRKSQYKFAAAHNGLEIIRHSHFCFATLNRQLILVLSSLGVPDEVFIDKLRMMLANLERAMTNEQQAVHFLQTYVDPNQMTLILADMVRDGFQKSREPFVSSLLELWRTWQIKYLKEKAKIAIDKGAYLFGCVDETNTLKGYFRSARPGQNATYEEKVACLPQIFVQVWRHDEGKYSIIEGLCIIARNPSLHPGDIRVVKASQLLSPEERPQFDERILNSGIVVDEVLLSFATNLKTQYDEDMRRIMAQHEIKTEFEVWSTFVLSHSEMTKDYKFHEDIGRISSALREKFRILCHEKAGGKEFKHLAPLAVAMYKVTSDQMQAAIAAQSAIIIYDSQWEEKKLPLISFPWVLQPILGRIANEHFGKPVSRRGCSAHIQVEIPRGPKPKRIVGSLLSPDVETADGVKHAGNVLPLFGDSKLDPFALLCEMSDTPLTSAHQTEHNIPSFPKINGQKGEGADLFPDISRDASTSSISSLYPNIHNIITIPARKPLVQHITPPTASTDLNGTDYRSVSPTYFENPYIRITQREVNGLKLGDANTQRTNPGVKRTSGSAMMARDWEEEEEVEEERKEIIESAEDLQPSALDELEQLIRG
ncbi:RNA-directed RNA polymerase [[Emmonsia] crescens]|uniref:RNA-dependent RNA polymerase n=1 Tax=[Emmonsia] crescens TaxID=73230 RepID=A0A0G2JA26_9EURO|nr:RNA-directed RNA polymerase [Emmonsia crescens UAMH 3008]